jgi:uncharacterized SAM-binding protein YcdF (DUF218 family)
MKKQSPLHPFLMFFILLAFFWTAGLLWFVTLIPSHPTEDNRNADAIVVLTGGSLRLDHGLELLIAGKAKKMFVSGVEDGITVTSLLHSKEYRPFADHIDEGSINFGYWARSTIGNAEETAQWAVREHVTSIRLVTGNYHMPRSIFELRETMPGITIIPDPVFPSHFANNEWWQWASSIKLVISEYHKFIASVIVHPLLTQSW